MATYVNDLRLKEIGTGESSGTWGTETNVNLELIGEALGYGTEGITTNADTHTTTVADGSTDPGRAMYIEYTGTLDSACTITIAPNTLSRLHYIENGTSGSQNIIIKQGSGATVTIPPGDTKAVYLDGAGSGAKVVDVFASFSVVDLKVQDDLTVTDDATVGGTLGVTGILTCTDDIIIGDGKTIGSASDVDAMTIASNGQVTFTQTLIGTALDISGDIDVDGTANLDIVDIDGATNIAAAVTMATNNKIQFRDDAIHISSTTDGQLDLVADTEIQIAATTIDINGAINASGEIIAASLDISGDIDVDGTTNLDIVDIDGAVDMASTLGVTGVLTANAGVVVDNITIDGTQIDLSSGDLTLDVAGKILLSADDAGTIQLFDGSLHYGSISEDNSNLIVQSIVQDEDILFRGDDGGSVITALTLDMSAAGAATFNSTINTTGITAQTGGTGAIADVVNFNASGNGGSGRGTGIVIGAPGSSSVVSVAKIAGLQETAASTANNASLAFQVAASDGTLTERMRITNTGAVSANVVRTSSSNATILTLKDNVTGAQTDGVYKAIRSESNGTSSVSEIRFIESDGSNNNTAIGFATAASAGAISEKVRIHPGGVASFNNGIELGSGLDATTANTLDDYEEGTWTPVIQDTSSGAVATMNTGAGNLGAYTKVGRNVSIYAHIVVSSLGDCTGPIRLIGLPFTNINSQSGRAGMAVGLALNLDITAGNNITGYVELNQSFIELNIFDSTGGTSALTAEELSADGVFFFGCTYPAA